MPRTMPWFWVAVFAFVALSGCADEPSREGPKGGVLVALGDSVAAGHGLGDARGFPSNPATAFPTLVAEALEMEDFNFAISGACIVTPDLDPDAGAGCTRSILEDQLPAVMVDRADVVLVTIGANDILFSRCFRAFITDRPPSQDPCQGPTFEKHLMVIERNLPQVIEALRERFGADVRILLTQYYNPLPPPTEVVEHACDLWGPAALARRPELVPVPKDSPTFRQAVLEVQREAWDYGTPIVDALNERIARVAEREGTETVRFDVSGHDPCAAIRGLSASQTWIFGIQWSDGSQAPAPLAPPRYESRPMPGPCPHTALDPPDEQVHYGGVAGNVSYGYTVYVKINCLAHPTLEGQAALAEQVLGALRGGATA